MGSSLFPGCLRTVLAATGMLLGIGGCSYQSAYVAPADGRPRVVWGPDNQPIAELAGAGALLSPECGAELRHLTGHAKLPTAAGAIELPENVAIPAYSIYRDGREGGGGYWTPRYYGSPIVIVTPGIAPLLGRPPIFSPSLFIARSVLRPGGGFGGGLRVGGGGSGGRSGGGSGNLGNAGLVLAALAIAVLPAIDIGLAAAHPESASQTSEAIDLVNAYNDLMRSGGSPCSPYLAAAPEPGGPQ